MKIELIAKRSFHTLLIGYAISLVVVTYILVKGFIHLLS